ncbi:MULTISPECIES: hypothetical protein [Helcococcus]|uniref:Uncharacterized protein n=1 Tax=Helcococcus bovis TaxID=3153252 RepID=A0ABW9F733_9FIRM
MNVNLLMNKKALNTICRYLADWLEEEHYKTYVTNLGIEENEINIDGKNIAFHWFWDGKYHENIEDDKSLIYIIDTDELYTANTKEYQQYINILIEM